jgi:hypothetical protein
MIIRWTFADFVIWQETYGEYRYAWGDKHGPLGFWRAYKDTAINDGHDKEYRF